GQCFRISEVSENIWEVIAFGKNLKIRSCKNNISIFECDEKEYNEIWHDYFDMRRDYGEIKAKIRSSGDNYLIKAVEFGYGMRILNQNLWEVIVSFIISQQNNIPRIRGIIDKLCKRYDGQFPSPERLAQWSETDLEKIGLGYRAKYVRNIAIAATEGKFDFEKIQRMNYENSIEYLKNFDGIGNKVANCIALFGLRKLEAFPIDVWINRILQNQYGGKFNVDFFHGYAGIVQQYMFYYERFRQKI
ncbi:MAG: DNA-3-methyladenine glycosylase 2 family protein, partial [Alphaproteobacteria bacterium]|nr:DNA-3-methyladenine glycosylase 2 family protein [Alphaproteobacteria bacterium]